MKMFPLMDPLILQFIYLFNLYLFLDKKVKFKKLITTMIYKTIFTYLTEKLKAKM